ncbi:MAG: MBL fold metallo-hydrolase [Gemmatimonadales bacterium]|nr:MAG: MBL fold metallo-hydrolase [Gemmatimonadales bacterium]
MTPTGGASEKLEIRSFTGGAFSENGYLVWCADTKEAAVVDPGAAVGELLAAATDQGLQVTAVFLTHAHLDHVEGLPELRKTLDVPIYLHPADRALYDRAAQQAEAFGMRLPGPLPEPDRVFEPGTSVTVGEVEFEVRFTPGHAPGHVTLFAPSQGVALVGDVVFAGSIGRTDLPGGDMQQLLASIRREILSLPDDVRLLPGHGPETTVGRERTGNPFLISQSPGTWA